MFHRKTLFILGAGASAEIGLPLGGGLASVIASKMDVRFEMGHRPIGTGDFDLYSRICAVHHQETSEYQEAAWLIRDGIHFARSIDDFLDIVHPYGVIDTSVRYGSTQANHIALADGIKTYTEQISDPKIMDAISDKIEKAETIVFLGFAYHDQNMKLLEPVRKFPKRKPIYGTAFGMSDSDVGIVSNQIEDWVPGLSVRISTPKTTRIENGLKCAELFDYY